MTEIQWLDYIYRESIELAKWAVAEKNKLIDSTWSDKNYMIREGGPDIKCRTFPKNN